jgi:hypothetical protein
MKSTGSTNLQENTILPERMKFIMNIYHLVDIIPLENMNIQKNRKNHRYNLFCQGRFHI